MTKSFEDDLPDDFQVGIRGTAGRRSGESRARRRLGNFHRDRIKEARKPVATMRRSSVRKRLERLEEIRQKRASELQRDAFIEILAEDCVERHLVMTSPPNAQRCFFQERPGPGPQLADFGEFSFVMHLTYAEMNG